MIWIFIISIMALSYLTVLFCMARDKKNALINLAFIAVAVFVVFLLDQKIQEEKTFINSYQLESIEKIENAYYLVEYKNGKKEYIEAENVEVIEDSTCTQPYIQVYEITKRSSEPPIFLMVMYFNSQYGSSTTMKYEITVSIGFVENIPKAN